MDVAIGGYFELELPRAKGERHEDAYRFQSASAAFLALLQKKRPRQVWMPWYICESMTSALRIEGIPFRRYEIDKDLNIREHLTLEKDEWIVYVNYFGICDRHLETVLNRYPPEQVVIDSAQAFFSSPRQCLATIYSPRKFFGVPDGGYLVTDIEMPPIEEIDRGSINRCAHLMRRLEGRPESGYEDYRKAEESLSKQPPKRMSQLTQRILASIDYEKVRARRNSNFFQLHEKLSEANGLPVLAAHDAAPMTYPFFCEIGGIREKLRAKRVFIPKYWPSACAHDLYPEWERKLSENCLALPCDQRYSAAHMERILNLIGEILI